MYQNEHAIGIGQQNLKEQVARAACDSSNACGVTESVCTIRTEIDIPANRSFGNALEHLKRGSKVTRHGWNGKGMWLELQRPDRNSKMTLPYVFLCYPTDRISPTPGARVPWLASQTDMLAEDWAVLPD